MPDIPNADLMKLLQLSQSLPLDVGSGEITPIMALGIIRAHERYGELTRADFGVLMEGLGAKSRCYGYVFGLNLTGYDGTCTVKMKEKS